MSVKLVTPSVDLSNNVQKNKLSKSSDQEANVQNTRNNVAFKGFNPIVSSMNLIDKGGYAASFCIQDGLGFIAPRVHAALVRGKTQKVDEDGNLVYDKKGNPVYNYNLEFARKELIREVVTGPSAFIIPWLCLKGINKFGSANNVKVNYINGFNNAFSDYAKNNIADIKADKANRFEFYKNVFAQTIDDTINSNPKANKLTADEVNNYAEDYAKRQIQIEDINADKSLSKKARKQKLSQIESVQASFMELKKNRIGGNVDELSVKIMNSDGKLKTGTISELVGALGDYFGDAVKNVKKALPENVKDIDIDNIMKSFTNRRMGTRILTNLGLFSAVAAFYTQIPKMYNAGLDGNPALKGTGIENLNNANDKNAKDTVDGKSKNVNFAGISKALENLGDKVFKSPKMKSVSDVFEINGPIISGMEMPILLYGTCIPPRLIDAQDKYDLGEILIRDMLSFSALLFGAKALARGFSDGFTKLTGLTLNRKDLEGQKFYQKALTYLNPSNGKHTVLSSAELDSKYTNIDKYKGGINGFVEFIESNGGNIKKAFKRDKNIKAVVNEILTEQKKNSFEKASVAEIKEALSKSQEMKTASMEKLFKLFKSENGLLNVAKTCNSSFNFLSTFLLVPSFIIMLTNVCKNFTEKRIAEDMQKMNEAQKAQQTV